MRKVPALLLVLWFSFTCHAEPDLVNISTRGFVGTGDEVLIGGFIISGSESKTVTIRARGPSLAQADPNLAGLLSNPQLQLFDSTGTLIDSNNDWQNHTSASLIREDLRPTEASESALTRSLSPGAYTAIVSGINSETGIAIVEVIDVNGTDTSASGLWIGESISDQGAPRQQFGMITTNAGELVALSYSNGAQFVGRFSKQSASFSGDAIGVTPAGFTWLNGESKIATLFEGTFTKRAEISARWSAPATGESGSLNFQYDQRHLRASSKSNFQGNWVTVSNLTLSSTGIPIYAGTVDSSFDFQNGDFSGTDIIGCTYSGGVSPLSASENIYRVTVFVSNCQFAGKYTGLGTLLDSVLTNGQSNPSTAFIFGVNNGVNYLTDVLFENN
jgi:hypothetical protein